MRRPGGPCESTITSVNFALPPATSRLVIAARPRFSLRCLHHCRPGSIDAAGRQRSISSMWPKYHSDTLKLPSSRSASDFGDVQA